MKTNIKTTEELAAEYDKAVVALEAAWASGSDWPGHRLAEQRAHRAHCAALTCPTRRAELTDYAVMLARTKARNRGATPLEVQVSVARFETVQS